MTPERQIPSTLAELAADVLAANEAQRATVDALAGNVAALAASLEHVAVGLSNRPTKRQTLRAGVLVASIVAAVVVALLCVIWFRLAAGQRFIREQVEMGGSRQAQVVCGILADGRSYHVDADPLPPGCPTTTTGP